MAAAEVDLDALRPHRPGTPASRISWPAFARTGDLHERVMRADADTRPLVVLDLRGTRVEADVDAAVRAAGSLCVHLADRGGVALLLPGERRPLRLEPGLRGWPQAHARLAVVEAGDGPALTGLSGRRGAILWVAARPLSDVPSALRRAPGNGPDPRHPRCAPRAPGRLHGGRLHRVRARRHARSAQGGRSSGGELVATATLTSRRVAVREQDARRAALVRLLAFAPLCLVGALAWADLVAPAAGLRAWAGTALAVAGGAALIGAARLEGDRRRNQALGATCAVLVIGALIAAGVPVRLLVPDRWDELAAGIADGIRAMPGIVVPYSGEDEWVRITLLLGAMLLAVLGALQSFWPRPGGGLPGSPLLGAFSLGVLYAVPVIERAPQHPFLSGGIFSLLLAAFLFADRVRPAQLVPAVVLVMLATGIAAASAPAFDRERPWLDYQQLADGISTRGTVGYRWNHDYRPLNWPRTGRELLRIKAQTSSYWKTEVLDTFDGHVWRRANSVAPFEPDTERDASNPQWVQDISVKVTGLRSSAFVTAGDALQVTRGPSRAVGTGGGTFGLASGGLRPGSTYRAKVYTPRPSPSQLARAGTNYPSFAREWLRVRLPDVAGYRPASPQASAEVSFPLWSMDQAALVTVPGTPMTHTDGAAVVRSSGLGRIYRLARRLRARSATPYDFVRAVQNRVQSGATYTERPVLHPNELDAFLFDDRRGYCQHFSGAMALLLRMGGVPARIATGFSPGLTDRKRGTYVVRDYDAHSWVEAYFPGLGWITFDPTPAAAPPREQVADSAAALSHRRSSLAAPEGGSFPSSGAGASGGSASPWGTIAGITAAVLLIVAGGAWALTRRRRALAAAARSADPDVAALERALQRSGRAPAPAATLQALESALGGTPGSSAYLRAVTARRFGPGGPPPTAAQRRALRTELSAGLGPLWRIRGYWALPPAVITAIPAALRARAAQWRGGGGARPRHEYP